MDNLGRYLETLYSAADGMSRAVAATIVHWRDEELSEVADSCGLVVGRKQPKASDNSRGVVSTVHAQLRLPTHARITKRRSPKGKTRDVLVIMTPDEWYMDNGEGSVERGSDDIRGCPHSTDVQRHFDGSLIREFFVGLRLEDRGAMTFLNAECARFRAYPRTRSHIWPHWLPANADQYEFVGDIHSGFLLSITGILNGETYEKYEVTRIEQGAVFEDDVFSFDPESAEVIEATKQPKHVASPSVAQSHAGFVVFAPTFVPEMETSQLEVMLDHRAGGEAPKVMLMYRGASCYEHLWIEESTKPDPEKNDYEWEDINLPDTSARISDPGTEGMRIISMVKNGTHIAIFTDLARATALDVASSLAPC